MTSSDLSAPPIFGVRLRVQIFLRWLAIAGQSAAVLAVSVWLAFPLPLAALFAVIGASVILNVVLTLAYPPARMVSASAATGCLAFDLIQLSALLYLTGGLANPFALLFLAPVTISASVLDGVSTARLVALAALLVSALAGFYEPLPWVGVPPDLPLLYRLGIWAALMIALIFIPAYVWRVSREGRRMAAALAATQHVLAREQHLSALDGLAAASAHRLGTPLGTIALVSGELQGHDNLPAAVRADAALIREQAQRCREILQSLAAPKLETDPVLARLSLHHLLATAVDAGARGAEVSVALSCAGAGDEPDVARRPELVYGLGNMVENACAYARSRVVVAARYTADEIAVDIADDGPGFRPDILTRLGEPYPRTRRSGRDEKTGLGLGFFIARTLLARSGGRLEARNLGAGERIGEDALGGACVTAIWARGDLEWHDLPAEAAS